jgi:Sulfotransferase family
MNEASDAGRVRAIILTTQRTGSTFLVWCLDSHPDIDCAGELLIGVPEKPGQPGYRGPFQKFYKLKNIIKSGAWLPGHRMNRYFSGGDAKVRAFKVMYNHLKYPPSLRYLRDHEEIRVVHLRRQNLLKLYVSRLLMPQRRQVQTRSPVEPIWVRVDPSHAIASMRAAQRRHEDFAALFKNHARLPISYETLIDGQYLNAETGRRICEFLGVTYRPMTAPLTKLNPESLQEMVTNYDELAEALSRTEFSGMLI